MIKLGEIPRYSRYFTTCGCPLVTHLGYADDILLFSFGVKDSVEVMVGVIRRYERASGQKVNDKIFVHHRFDSERSKVLGLMTCFKVGCPSFIYLGCPMAYAEGERICFSR